MRSAPPQPFAISFLTAATWWAYGRFFHLYLSRSAMGVLSHQPTARVNDWIPVPFRWFLGPIEPPVPLGVFAQEVGAVNGVEPLEPDERGQKHVTPAELAIDLGRV